VIGRRKIGSKRKEQKTNSPHIGRWLKKGEFKQCSIDWPKKSYKPKITGGLAL